MGYTEHDAQMDAYYDSLQKEFEENLKGQARDAVKSYLGRFGDAVDQRVLASLAEGKALLKTGHSGPALCLAAVAIELMIRFMLVRPLIQGAFLSDVWAEILTTRIVTRRTADDRELVSAVLRQWGLDLAQVRAAVSKAPVWEFTVTRLFPSRNGYLHQYDGVTEEIAAIGIECAEAFRYQIVGQIAKHLGFTLDATGKWCQILRPGDGRYNPPSTEDFTPDDPFAKATKSGA